MPPTKAQWANGLFALATNSLVPMSVLWIAISPHAALEAIPDVFPSLPTLSWRGEIPPHPTKMAQAWQLGSISEKLVHCADSAAPPSCVQTHLSAAGKVLQREGALSEEDLTLAFKYMTEMESHKGLLARVYGAMDLINFMWLVGTLGILLTVVPCMSVILHKIGAFQLLATLVSAVVRKVILLVRLAYTYTSFLWCPIAYLAIVSGYAHALRFTSHNATAGTYLALLALGCHVIVTGLHATTLPEYPVLKTLATAVVLVRRLATGSASRDPKPTAEESEFLEMLARHVPPAYSLALAIPTAIAFQSTLFGWVAVLAIFAWLGFFVLPIGLGYYIGFSGEDAMSRCAVTALCLSLAFFAVRIASDNGECFDSAPHNLCFPFMQSAQVMGLVVYFLALLITTSRGYSRDTATYWQMQGVFVVSMVIAATAGLLFNVNAAFATTCVFAVLYTIDKVLELPVWNDKGTIFVGLACASFGLWRLAVLLNSRPDLVVAAMSVLTAMVDESRVPGRAATH